MANGIDHDELEKLLDEIPHARASPLHRHSDCEDGIERKSGRRHEKLDGGDGHARPVSSSRCSSASRFSVNAGLSVDGTERQSSPSTSDECLPSFQLQMMGGQRNQIKSWLAGEDSPVSTDPNVGGCNEELQIFSNTFEELGIREFSDVAANKIKANDLDDGFHPLCNTNPRRYEIRRFRPHCGDNNVGDSSKYYCRGIESSTPSRLNAQYGIDTLNSNLDLGGSSLFDKFGHVNNLAGNGSYLQSPQDGRGLYASQSMGMAMPLSVMPFSTGYPLNYGDGLMARRYGTNAVKHSYENLQENVMTDWAALYHLSMMRNAHSPNGFGNKTERMLNNIDKERNQSDGLSIFAQNGKNGYTNLNFLGYFVDESFELSAVNPKPGGFPWSIPSNHNSLWEIQGRISDIAKDQQGCRYLQRKLARGAPEEFMMIFSEIIGHAGELMKDPFGNYLMQRLLEVCTEPHRTQIVRVVTAKPKELFDISVDAYGTRVVQKLIRTLKLPCQISMVISSLEPWAVDLIMDLNGNHVVQRCLECLGVEDNKFLFYASVKYCVKIAAHQEGCCVLKCCLDHSTGIYRQILVEEIAANALLLSQDAYGNYVVQYVLGLKIQWAIDCIVCQLQGNFVSLSMQKYSSNVVEKCLGEGGDNIHSIIIRELVSSSSFEQLPQDPFGNYVIQSAIRKSKGPIRSILMEAIRPLTQALRSNPYAKKIISLIQSKK